MNTICQNCNKALTWIESKEFDDLCEECYEDNVVFFNDNRIYDKQTAGFRRSVWPHSRNNHGRVNGCAD